MTGVKQFYQIPRKVTGSTATIIQSAVSKDFCSPFTQQIYGSTKQQDLAAAFNSIDIAALWRMMEHRGVPGKVIRLIKAFYQCTSV